jgi:hypothetical protein
MALENPALNERFNEAYVDPARSCRETFPYEKALRKRRVWVESLFAEAKDRHGLRRFRLSRLEKLDAEALLIASCQNVERLLTFGTRRPRRETRAAALRASMRPSSYVLRAARRHFGSGGATF